MITTKIKPIMMLILVAALFCDLMMFSPRISADEPTPVEVKNEMDLFDVFDHKIGRAHV